MGNSAAPSEKKAGFVTPIRVILVVATIGAIIGLLVIFGDTSGKRPTNQGSPGSPTENSSSQ